MPAGMVSVVDAEPTVDAASYWSAFAAMFGSEDPGAGLLEFLSGRLPALG